jgi:Ca-activated chloride channel homolog
MRRILLSLGMIVFVGAVAVGATGAFFNDTETSTGNTFAAGDIDLKIDNESYAIDFNIPGFQNPTGALVANPANSWALTDLTDEKFFDFSDVKPGDYGEDTISIHVGSNDAWMCAAARVTVNSDETCTEPENTDENGLCVPEGENGTNGELADVLQFAFWVDDGDNVFEPGTAASGTPETIFLGGPLSGLGAQGQIALAQPGGGALGNDPVPGDSTFYIGKIWCAGTLTPTNEPQDGFGDVKSPLDGTGFTCDGTLVDNQAQTDKVVGDMEFYATQARNNPQFSCAEDYVPTWNEP